MADAPPIVTMGMLVVVDVFVAGAPLAGCAREVKELRDWALLPSRGMAEPVLNKVRQVPHSFD